ncbi:MAG TPA: DUF4436 family protein [Acidobacteriaceae bacterium]
MANIVRNRKVLLSVLLGLAFVGLILGVLSRTINEKAARSLELNDEVSAGDHVLVSIVVIKVDPATLQLTARIRIRPLGNIAQATVTPNANLRFFINNAPGQQVFEFKKGDAIRSIEVTVPINGDINRYPFDHYTTNVWLFMDTPDVSGKPKVSDTPPEVLSDEPGLEDFSHPGVVTPNRRAVPISIHFVASTPGMKYEGEIIRSGDTSATRVHLDLKRPTNLVNLSVTVMCLMMGIAVSVAAMVLKAVFSRQGALDVLPLSLSIGLIFGLPALRNVQPGVPPVGVLGDYFSFIWAELFVAAAAIMMAVIWVFGGERKPDNPPAT